MRDFVKMKELFKNRPIFQELANIRKMIKNTDDPQEREEFLDREDAIREFSVSLLERVKNKDDGAFDDLMSIKDMRNFLYFYTYHIREYHKFKYEKHNVLHEVRYQIFYHVVNNYRIYDEPHEISLLITSMRNWIRQKVSTSLKSTYSPKVDEKLDSVFLEETENDESEILVRDLLIRYLNEEEQLVFELKFFHGKGFVEIGQAIGASKDTAQRRYKRALGKLSKVLSKEL